MDRTLGILALSKSVDRRAAGDGFSLLVKATDGGSPSLSSVVPVTIHLTMSNNAPPYFTSHEYAAEIQENQPVGTFIIALEAISRSSVVYEMRSTDQEEEHFIINPNSGIVTSNAVLDYEKSSFFNLTIQATNMVGVSAETQLLVHVVDENDNAPNFTAEFYTGYISEASPAGTNILDENNFPLVVKATDEDNDLNALLSYQIHHSNAKDIFEIDTNTGAIRAKATLDHEVAAEHVFSVQVSDMGTPRQTAQQPATVTVHVIDVNDSPPRFDKKVYEADLLLPTYKDVSIIQVRASDNDWEVNSTLQYSLERGNEDGHFAVHPFTGVVTVVEPGSMRDFYLLHIKVTDGVFENEASLKIHVQMSVDSGLQIGKEYHSELMENRTGVENVAVIQAAGHELNENLIFSILNTNEMFEIGATSGLVQTSGKSFDREVCDNYTLVIEVRDERTPVRIAHGLLHVHILDANDNVPIFVNKPYYAVASIDARKGEVIKMVGLSSSHPFYVVVHLLISVCIV